MPKHETEQQLEIVAGPNGSGKTTFAQSYLVRTLKRKNYLNPDIIASGVSPNYSTETAFQAGRIFLAELKERLHKKEDLGFESTLSGLTYLQILKTAKNLNYKITIYFLFTGNTKINLARIKKRVRMGGHNIPTKDVLRRYVRSFDNFWKHYRLLADNWIIFDNSNSLPKFVMSKDQFSELPKKQASDFESNFLKRRL